MKTKKIKSVFTLFFIFAGCSNTDAQTKPSLAVINIEAKGLMIGAETITNITRLEIEKTNTYNVMDVYEMNDLIGKDSFNMEKCHSKTCLLEIGKQLKVDKILSGSAERMGEKIILILRLIDVKQDVVEKTDIMEYINLPEIQKMIEISSHNITGIDNDPFLLSVLVNYDTPIASPKTNLKLDGPRMGCSYVTNPTADRLQAPISEGGYEMFPLTSEFGYQYETQYLSSGNFQALIEYILLVGGLESGRFIPSFSFLNGFRFSNSGFELGFGPVIKIIKTANGYYDTRNITGGKSEWHLKSEWDYNKNGPIENYYNVVKRIDNRGKFDLTTNLVIAVGKTFRSGYLQIPVNLYFIPNPTKGSVFGISFGFNINKNSKKMSFK